MLKVIQEFPNYKIDESGSIYRDGLIIKKQVNIDGYFVVNLYKEGVSGKSFHRRCGRLVGLTFLVDSYKKGLVINHKDFDRQNDHITNLEWITTAENNQHSIDGQPHLHTRGSEYTEEFIHSVCLMVQDGARNVEIVRKTGITSDVITKLRNGVGWTWISKDYKLTPSRRGISEETAKWVCYQLNEGVSYKDILSSTTCKKLTINMLKHIKSGKSWSKISKHILN